MIGCIFLFQAEDGIRGLVRSRGLGDVYKRQPIYSNKWDLSLYLHGYVTLVQQSTFFRRKAYQQTCLLYTSDAADERSSVDLGGRRIIKKKNNHGYILEDLRNIKKNIQQRDQIKKVN